MYFFQKDSVWVGIVISVFFTVTMFYCFYTINQMCLGAIFMGKPFGGVTERFISTLAVFSNILPFIIYIKTRKDLAMKGVGIVTVLLALFVLMFYYIL